VELIPYFRIFAKMFILGQKFSFFLNKSQTEEMHPERKLLSLWKSFNSSNVVCFQKKWFSGTGTSRHSKNAWNW